MNIFYSTTSHAVYEKEEIECTTFMNRTNCEITKKPSIFDRFNSDQEDVVIRNQYEEPGKPFFERILDFFLNLNSFFQSMIIIFIGLLFKELFTELFTSKEKKLLERIVVNEDKDNLKIGDFIVLKSDMRWLVITTISKLYIIGQNYFAEEIKIEKKDLNNFVEVIIKKYITWEEAKIGMYIIINEDAVGELESISGDRVSLVLNGKSREYMINTRDNTKKIIFIP
jgi:hypothetical protein